MAWARAFYALAQGLSPGDRILTGMVEYGANYVAMLQVTCSSRKDVVYTEWVQELCACTSPPFSLPGSVPIALCTLVRSSVGPSSLKPTQAGTWKMGAPKVVDNRVDKWD